MMKPIINWKISQQTEKKKKRNAVGEPHGDLSDDSDGTDDMTFLSDEEDLKAELIDHDDADERTMHGLMTDAVLDVQNDLEHSSKFSNCYSSTL